jgi:hypothetical protein
MLDVILGLSDTGLASAFQSIAIQERPLRGSHVPCPMLLVGPIGDLRLKGAQQWDLAHRCIPT